MPRFDRHLWRLAGRLENRIARLHSRTVNVSLDHQEWQRIERLAARMNDIADRPWRVASDHVCWQLLTGLQRLRSGLGTIFQGLPEGGRFLRPPKQKLIYEELVAARDEFDDFVVDLRRQTLSVMTSEVELEGIYLGRFRILLDLQTLSESVNYSVTAESPNRAAARSDVTHPHVMDDRLCEGDAKAPLSSALRTGRFCDFFQIIEQTLHSYNPDSAYASLAEWNDHTTCHSCGDRIPEYEGHYCDQCEADTCEDCCTSCGHCHGSACDLCIEKCSTCDDGFCSTCLEACPRCSTSVCPDCLTDSLCKECHANSLKTNTADAAIPETGADTASPEAPVHAHRLGETAVPAGSG